MWSVGVIFFQMLYGKKVSHQKQQHKLANDAIIVQLILFVFYFILSIELFCVFICKHKVDCEVIERIQVTYMESYSTHFSVNPGLVMRLLRAKNGYVAKFCIFFSAVWSQSDSSSHLGK